MVHERYETCSKNSQQLVDDFIGISADFINENSAKTS